MSSLRGPRARQVRRKTFLYPKEAARMLSCGGIEIEWRAVYAIALYTYLRPGELACSPSETSTSTLGTST